MKTDYIFSVAPMMGYTTPHARYFYRLLSKKTILFTEMIASQALIRLNKNNKFEKNYIDNPVILQIGGNNERELIECCQIAKKFNYNSINLNIGCPSKKVQKGSFGACLMKDPLNVSRMIRSMIKESEIDVSIKCRLGVDNFDSYEFLKKFISINSDAGCKIFFIHARKALLKGLNPHQNRNIPELQYDKVYKIKEEFKDLKIIINGGINSLNECNEHLKYVDGVMLGRLIQSNPLILNEVDHIFFGSEKEKINKYLVIKDYFNYIRKKLGEDSIFRLLSPLLNIFFAVPNSKKIKSEINNNIKKFDIDKLERLFFELN